MKKYELTEVGRKYCENYLAELKAKRKEILDAKKDTITETNLPETVEEIFEDALSFGIDENGLIGNSWGVTDNYDADYPTVLRLGFDFVEVVQPKNWEEFEEKWPMDRDDVSKEKRNDWLSDLYHVYAETGSFLDAFINVGLVPAYHKYHGMRFDVVEEIYPNDSWDFCSLPAWKVKFANGDFLEVYPEEITCGINRNIDVEITCPHCGWVGTKNHLVDGLCPECELKVNCTTK